MSPSVGGSVVVGGSLLNTCTEGNDPPPSFLSLKCDLESEAFSQCNFGLISNGGGSARQAKNQYRRFVCRDVRNRVNTKYATSRKTAIQLAQTGNLLRTSKLINNRSGDRKDGKSKPRRTTTNIGNHSCTFCFTVRWDSLGLYISLEKSSGCPTHKFHIRSTTSSLPTRLLGDDERETLGHLAASCCTTGVGQSYLLAKVGRFMSNSKVAYIYDQAASSNQPALDTNEAGTCRMSEYDHLTRYFEQTKDIAYTVLWDVCAVTPAEESTTGTAGAMMNVETEMVSTPTTASSGRGAGHSSFLMSHTKFDNQNSCTKDHSNDPSMIGLREEGLTFRANYNVSHDTKVFLAIAWVFKPELRYFKLFPEVIHVDGTSHSTEKKYELITFSIKTSLGRQVVFLRVWLPDQKRSSFRWLFQHVLAGLVPSNVFQRTRLVMGDGDRQQQAEIEAAIQEYMPNARFGSCGWHIVDRGWRRNGPTTNSFSTQRKKKEVQIFFRGVRTWIYSW